MIEALFLIIGLLAGAAVAYAVMLRRRGALAEEVSGLRATVDAVKGQLGGRESELGEVRAALETEKVAAADQKARLESAREHFAEQRRQIEEMEKKVKETFAALSSAALKSSNEQFITLAEAKLKPIREQLERYEKHLRELEKTRAEAHGGLNKHLTRLEQGREQLSSETQALVAALRQPGAKGRWGEVGLRNLMERCGMSAYCDFDEQVSMTTESGRQRPDMVVRIPGGRNLVIDAKVNTAAYLDAVQAVDEAEKKRHLEKYARDVRNTARALAGKAYWKQFDRAPEFVVMFMPSEAFFAAALAEDPNLLNECLDDRVLPASPTTLAGLLMAIKHGWQQQQMAENAEQIAKAGRDLHDRLCTFVGHLDAVRVGIERAAEAYDKVVGNWEHRTLPSVNRLADLGADSGKRLEDLRPSETHMRPFLSPSDDGADDEDDARAAS